MTHIILGNGCSPTRNQSNLSYSCDTEITSGTSTDRPSDRSKFASVAEAELVGGFDQSCRCINALIIASSDWLDCRRRRHLQPNQMQRNVVCCTNKPTHPNATASSAVFDWLTWAHFVRYAISELSMGPFRVTRPNPTHWLTDSTQYN